MHLSLGVLIAFSVSCGDATGPRGDFPPPPGPPKRLLVARAIGYFASQPEGRQATDFTYGGDGNLLGWAFGELIDGVIDTTIRQEVVFRPDGSLWGYDKFLRVGGVWFHRESLRFALADGKPVEAYVEVRSETGAIEAAFSVGLRQDTYGRVVETRNGPEIDTFEFDANGDIVRMRSDDIRFGVQVATMRFGKVWNPFAGFPLLHGAPTGLFAPDLQSLHLSQRWENAEEGQPPASVATAVIVANAAGYPVRREYTIQNAGDAQSRTTAVTEYEYFPE